MERKRFISFVLLLCAAVLFTCGALQKSLVKQPPAPQPEIRAPEPPQPPAVEKTEDIYAGLVMPRTVDIKIAHMPPLGQFNTGTCWCFSTTSLIESELMRLGRGTYKLSEMFVVYHTYLEKAENYLKSNGEAVFGQGGLSHDWIAAVKKYGIVRWTDYNGLLPQDIVHNHSGITGEIKKILDRELADGNTAADRVMEEVKTVLNRHLGTPPDVITVNDRTVTPKQFADGILNIPYDDYIEVMSFEYAPFYKKAELTVPDNWRHYDGYYNVPLNQFVKQIDYALERGFSAAIDYDVSRERGYNSRKGMAIIPDSDIPQNLIDQDAREERFKDGRTRDDHLVHIIGRKYQNGNTWYLIKDSSGMRSPLAGYHFLRDDYVRLKVLAYMIHKDAVMPEVKARMVK